jgi:hypothetical protein
MHLTKKKKRALERQENHKNPVRIAGKAEPKFESAASLIQVSGCCSYSSLLLGSVIWTLSIVQITDPSNRAPLSKTFIDELHQPT